MRRDIPWVVIRSVLLAPTLKERFEDLDYVDLRFGDRVFVHGRRPGARNRMVNVR